MANNWIFISCPLRRVTSGRSNSAVSKSIFQNFSYTQTLSRVKSTKINPYTNMKQNIHTHTHATQILEELVAPIIIAFVSVWSFLLLAFYMHISISFIYIIITSASTHALNGENDAHTLLYIWCSTDQEYRLHTAVQPHWCHIIPPCLWNDKLF